MGAAHPVSDKGKSGSLREASRAVGRESEAQYRLAPAWLLSLGFAYDSSAVGDADRIPALPVDRQLRYAIGIQYDWNQDVTWGLAYEFVDLGNAPINIRRGPLAGQLTGDYPTNHIQFVATNLIWKF